MQRCPSVCVIIVNYNGVDYVRRSIESAIAQEYDGDVTVVVVDNDSTDASLPLLRGIDSIEILESARNDGFASAANRAAHASAAEYLAFLNPDAIADATWLAKLIPWMQLTATDVASSIVGAGAGVYFAGARYVKFFGTTVVYTSLRERTDWVSGCALVVRRDAFVAIRGFDERYFLYYEDVDFCLRARARNFTIGVLPESLVEHPRHGMSTNALGTKKAEIAFTSRGRFIATYTPCLTQPFALFIAMTFSPLGNGVRGAGLLRIARAVLRGYVNGRAAGAWSRAAAQRTARVGVLANIFEPGAGILAGGHLHFVEVVKRWKDVNITVFAPEMARDGFMAALPHASFVPLPSLASFRGGKALDFFYRSFAALSRIRQLRRCDVFLATSHLLPDVLPAIVSGRPTAVVVHHLLSVKNEAGKSAALIPTLGERLSLLMIRLFVKCVIASSPSVLRELRSRRFRMTGVVTTSGVDHLTFAPLAHAESLRTGAVFVGRLHPSKNPMDAIRAWNIVARRFPQEVLTIIGAEEVPDYALELRALVAQLGLEGRVRFAGTVSDEEKQTALIAAKVFLFPSLQEGWGIAVAEAMRAGLPCVTYDLQIFSEIFPSGRLAAPIGNVEILAGHVNALFADEALRLRYAGEARLLAQDFTWERASQIEGIALSHLFDGDRALHPLRV